MAPDESLILTKPLMEVAHGGGRRLKKGDPVHQILRDWIAEGLRLDAESCPDVVKIEVVPQATRLRRPGATASRLRVLGHFSDGTVRDVTALTAFSVRRTNRSPRSTTTGLVDKNRRGETAILARYLDKMDTSHITFLEDVPGFAWNNPPENNFVDSAASSPS